MKQLLVASVLLLIAVTAAEALTPAAFQKVFILVLENTGYADAVAQPFLASLAARAGRSSEGAPSEVVG